MPHQCTQCGNIYPDAAPELLSGCSCGARFFYYIRQEKVEQMQETIQELEKADLVQIEEDIREITGLDEEPDKTVVLDLESVRVISPGKFEIDLVKLLSKKDPLIYKIGEGKYIIDLATSLNQDKKEIKRKLKNFQRESS
jgi:uncharacterized protein